MPEFTIGDEIRVIKTGSVGILDDINPSGAEHRKADDESWGSATSKEGYFIEIDNPSDIAFVRRAADIPTPILPTASELAAQFSGALHGGFGAISIYETDTNEPDGQFLAYGESATGRRFGCRVTVTEIELAD